MSVDESRRMRHTAQRKRILEGDWEDDLSHYIGEFIDPARRAAWGRPSRAVNLFRSVVTQIGKVYDEPPTILNPQTGADVTPLKPLFNLHQTHETYVLGLRESAVKVDWVPASHLGPARLSTRLVTPDVLDIDDSHVAPGVPAIIREIRTRNDSMSNKPGRYWDVWDLSDPDRPSFKILTEDRKRDVTATFAPDLHGVYSWIDSDGRPYLPWVLYHARATGRVWDPYTWTELVDGTLALGLQNTFYMHAIKDASWVQKYAVDVRLQGGETEDGSNGARRDRVSVDPASILMFKATGEGSPSLGAFPTPVEPEKMIESARAFQVMVCESLGIGSWDAQQLGGQSGAALTIRREQVRKIAASNMPQFAQGDRALLAIGAKLLNQYSGGPTLPEDGYQVEYVGLPPSYEEQTTELSMNLELVKAGLKSRVDLVLERFPHLDRERAIEYLQTIALEELTINAAGAPPPQ